MINYIMGYSIRPRDRIYFRDYGFLSFAKNVYKSLSSKYGQKLLGSTKNATIDALKTDSNRATPKTVEATEDPLGNKIA